MISAPTQQATSISADSPVAQPAPGFAYAVDADILEPLVAVYGVPVELRLLTQWILWREEEAKGRMTKVPWHISLKYRASSTKPKSWSTFWSAIIFASMNKTDKVGIGFVFSPDDPYCGIDLDACRNPETGEIAEWAMEIITLLNSYTEISPSQHGVKIFIRGKLPEAAKRNIFIPEGVQTFGPKSPEIAVYDKGRYFATTGHVLPGYEAIRDCQPELEQLVEKYLSQPDPARKPQAASKPHASNGIVPVLSSHDRQAIVVARLLRITSTDSGDGSRRLYTWACRCVEADLSDSEALQTIRSAEAIRPFPSGWTDEQVVARLRQAEKRAVRGSQPATSEKRKKKKSAPVAEIKKTDEGEIFVDEGDLTLDTGRTEIANGKRFAQQHKDKVRHCKDWGKWLVWKGTHWAPDADAEVRRLGKETALRIWRTVLEINNDAKTPDDFRPILVSFARQVCSSNGQRNMLDQASSEKPIAVTPKIFDANKWLFNCANGTIDLKSGGLREHRQEDYITKLSPVRYDCTGNAECDVWLESLDSIFGGDQEMVTYLRNLCGYTLTGEVTEQILPIFYGRGANGKSLIFSTVTSIFGDYAIHGARGLLIDQRNPKHPTEQADLFGRRLVVCSETGESQKMDEALVKDLTGGEKIRARKMREDFTEFEPTHKLWLATNHKPRVKGADDGIWRRVRLIGFEQTYWDPDDPSNAGRQDHGYRQDKKLVAKLKCEYPGILAWMVTGCLDWQLNGLRTPAKVMEWTKQYRLDEDQVTQFLSACCVKHPLAVISTSELCEEYRAFSNTVISHKAMNNAMLERDYKPVEGLSQAGKYRNRNGFKGIGLKSEYESSDAK